MTSVAERTDLGPTAFRVQHVAEVREVSDTSIIDASNGNDKCWHNSPFTFDMCCKQENLECWVWPFSWEFCCTAPLPPRRAVQVGGIPGDLARKGKVTSRCATSLLAGSMEVSDANQLSACTRSLDEIGRIVELSNIGSGDKASGWHDYLLAYEKVLLHQPLTANVVEIGVRSGASLAMWSEYFPFGTILGIDKNIGTFENIGRAWLQELGALNRGNVVVLQANATDLTVLDKLRDINITDVFADVVVDDANHWARDQIARFEIFFPHVLKSGGVYIIEDVHIQAPFSHDGLRVREYFSKLSESSYITDSEILLGAHNIQSRRRASTDWRHQVESVTLMRDMVSITKSA